MITPDVTPLWIVPMDRRTLYDDRKMADEVCAIARRQCPRYSFAVLHTGAAYVISAKIDQEPVTGWIFDGEFVR